MATEISSGYEAYIGDTYDISFAGVNDQWTMNGFDDYVWLHFGYQPEQIDHRHDEDHALGIHYGPYAAFTRIASLPFNVGLPVLFQQFDALDIHTYPLPLWFKLTEDLGDTTEHQASAQPGKWDSSDDGSLSADTEADPVNVTDTLETRTGGKGEWALCRPIGSDNGTVWEILMPNATNATHVFGTLVDDVHPGDDTFTVDHLEIVLPVGATTIPGITGTITDATTLTIGNTFQYDLTAGDAVLCIYDQAENGWLGIDGDNNVLLFAKIVSGTNAGSSVSHSFSATTCDSDGGTDYDGAGAAITVYSPVIWGDDSVKTDLHAGDIVGYILDRNGNAVIVTDCWQTDHRCNATCATAITFSEGPYTAAVTNNVIGNKTASESLDVYNPLHLATDPSVTISAGNTARLKIEFNYDSGHWEIYALSPGGSQYQLQLNGSGNLQYSTDGGSTWTTVSGWTIGSGC